MLLARHQDPVIVCAEHPSERRDVAEKRAGWFNVLNEPLHLDEGVLHRRRRQEQHRRRSEERPNPVCHERFFGYLVVQSIAVVPFMKTREDLMRLVDDDEVEQRNGT